MFTNILPTAMTRLQMHDVVIYDRRRHRVDEVNDCRARLRPLGGSDFISISPESELEIIGKWLPDEQRVKLFGCGVQPVVPSPLVEKVGSAEPETQTLTQTSFL